MARQLTTRNYGVIESEEALIERVRRGDAEAFEGLFLRHYGQVYRVLYNLVGSREEAEDLAQETFLALYHQPPALGDIPCGANEYRSIVPHCPWYRASP